MAFRKSGGWPAAGAASHPLTSELPAAVAIGRRTVDHDRRTIIIARAVAITVTIRAGGDSGSGSSGDRDTGATMQAQATGFSGSARDGSDRGDGGNGQNKLFHRYYLSFNDPIRG